MPLFFLKKMEEGKTRLRCDSPTPEWSYTEGNPVFGDVSSWTSQILSQTVKFLASLTASPKSTVDRTRLASAQALR